MQLPVGVRRFLTGTCLLLLVFLLPACTDSLKPSPTPVIFTITQTVTNASFITQTFTPDVSGITWTPTIACTAPACEQYDQDTVCDNPDGCPNGCGAFCVTHTPPPPTLTSTFTPTVTLTPVIVHSMPRFQVFILNPVHTCIAANDFYSGDVCRGSKCGDCNCTWDEFDPPAPLSGIPPNQINDPQYANFTYRECFDITLTDEEITTIVDDMLLTRDLIYNWTNGALDLQMEFTVLSHDHTGFVAPDFVFGPFEVDDELLNSHVTTNTDFVYVVTGVRDQKKKIDLAYWCGSSYGELSVRGAGYSYVQYNGSACNSVNIDGQDIYEPLIHEVYHNLDWALYNLNRVPDPYQFASPDWANWRLNDWPACHTSPADPTRWFPSIDFCEWDPDWMDCNNISSAGACIHASQLGGADSWYEHVMSMHYPGYVNYIGNFCRDGRQDFGETGVDSGGACQ